MQQLSTVAGKWISAPRPPGQALPQAGNEIYPHNAFSNHIEYCLKAHNDDQLDRLLRQAVEHRAPVISVPLDKVNHARQQIGAESVVILSTPIGFPADRESAQPSTEQKVAQVSQALENGTDELEVLVDLKAAGTGDSKALAADLKAVVEAAHGHVVKATLEAGRLNPEQIVIASKAAEEAGVQYLKDSSGLFASAHPHQDIDQMAQASQLHLEIGTVKDLQDCKRYDHEFGADRRLRFSGSKAKAIALQESQELREHGFAERQAELQEAFLSPHGQHAIAEFQELRSQFRSAIEAAHAEGKPFVFSSTCVRPNDTSATFEHNQQIRESLMHNIDAHGYAHTDPFAVEGATFLRDKTLPPMLAQELLMDPEVGFWPEVLSQCDAIAHGPDWKYSIGAREEDLIAKFYGIPTWDGSSSIAMRSASERSGNSMHFVPSAEKSSSAA